MVEMEMTPISFVKASILRENENNPINMQSKWQQKRRAAMFTDWLKKIIRISTVFILSFIGKIFTNKMTHPFQAIYIAIAVMLAVLPFAMATPAWAEGY